MAATPVVTILLGAGASVEAGVPAAKEMVRTVSDPSLHNEATTNAINAAIGGLRFHRSVARRDPFGEIDVEDLYAVLRALGERDTDLLAPFVGSWSHAITSAKGENRSYEIDQVASSISSNLRAELGPTEVHAPRERLPSDHMIGKAVRDIVSLARDHGPDTFSDAARRVLEILTGRSWISDAGKVDYLSPLIQSTSTSPLWIASLNYDNAIEKAAERVGCVPDFGIHEDTVRFAETAPLNLAKLHGSVNWGYDSNGTLKIAPRPMYPPALIFGSGNKLQVHGPYLDLLFAFRARLEVTEQLYVCGYSFRDEHVNHFILKWITDDLTKHRVQVIDPTLSLDQIHRNIASAMPRGWSLDRRNLVGHIDVESLKASEWIAKRYST